MYAAHIQQFYFKTAMKFSLKTTLIEMLCICSTDKMKIKRIKNLSKNNTRL